MEELIRKKILQIEEKYKVKVLWAIESGSRAWGFASADSDWDVRFIYVNRPEWYLTVFPKRDVIEEMDGDLDLAGWDLRKTLGLLCKSNPPLNEWLKSAIIYWQVPEAAVEMRQLASLYFNPKSVAYHYYRMALNDRIDYVKGQSTVRAKKYLYIHREMLP